MPATPSPYDARETLGLLWRNLAGPGMRNPRGLAFLASGTCLDDIAPRLTLGFAGDIMMMFGRGLAFGPQLRGFFAGCDHVVANLEGVITDLPKRGPDQKHGADIVDALATLVPPDRLVLSVANNHAGDFGEKACRASMERFAARGMRLFGLADTPAIDLGEHVRVVTGTRWSNRDGAHLAWLDHPEQHARAGALNILFPHWGHEMLCYPRVALQEEAAGWLGTFDAIVGHHSHTPQPVSALPSGTGRRLVAWSLGDLCFGLGYKRWPALRHYPWGIVLKVRVGPRRDDPRRWGVGEVQWRYTDCAPAGAGFVTEVVPRTPYFAGGAAEA